ncbi:MAG: DNA repair protein RecO [Planctomycetes bacterium]|nr:DNA repair protein RecO [Planctomycetota bacterium]MBL7146716.1 DNA repair protein RecO [Phycisphaerae bacterium]
MLTKDTAICIRAIDYSETSQILTFFTRDTGKIGAIAKGSKRPKSSFGGPFEIFSYGKIVFAESDKDKLSTLTEFESALAGAGFSKLSANLFTLNCCLFGAELLNKLTHDYDPHPQLFDDFLQFLQNAGEDTNNSNMLTLLILFQLSLLKETGLQPVLSHCVNCKSRYASRDTEPVLSAVEGTHEVYFSSSVNGLICRDCEAAFPDKIRLSPNAANCLSNLKLLTDAQEKTLKEIEKLLTHHLTEILGHKPKMAKYILNL